MDAIDRYGNIVYSDKVGEFKQVANQNPTLGSSSHYYAVKATFPDGRQFNALFTISEMERAMKRATNNPEDIPKEKGLFRRLLGL